MNAQQETIAPQPWPAAKLGWTTVAILAIASSISAVDRYLINLLVEPIKADLGLTDTQIGLLLGFAFGLFYTVMGLPIGRWADTYSRRLIIVCGAIFWSLMTMACGLAHSFKQLFLARMAVGVGEATLNPCGYSMISDYFPADRRAKPMSVFIMGATIGSAFVLYAGGLLLEYLTAHGVTWALPWGGSLKPWQITFVIAGLPGFAIALLVGFLKEPPRREMIAKSGAHQQKPAKMLPIREVAAYVGVHWKAYVLIFFSFGMLLLWQMGKNLWAPTFLMRTFGWSPAEVGLRLGVITLLGTSLGIVSGGWAAEWVRKRGHRDANLRTAFYGGLIGLPFAVTATIVPNQMLSVILLGPVFFFGAFPFALAPAAIAAITPNQMRAQITALYLLTINLLGFGVGPALIGAFTDYVYQDPKLIGWSMMTTAAIAIPTGLVLLRRGMGQYVRTIDELALQTTR